MNQRAIFRAAKWLVPLLLVLAACGDGVSSRNAATSEPETSEEAAEQPTETSVERVAEPDDNPPSTTSTTEAEKVDARPKTPELIAITGDVTIPDGEPGMFSIVMVGPPQGGMVSVIVRNRTSDPLYSVKVNGPARTAAGELIGSGRSLEFFPDVVQPGEWAFGAVNFGVQDLPADAQFELVPSADTEPGYGSKLNLRVTESNIIEETHLDQIVGIVENSTDKTLSSGISVAAACFDATGTSLLTSHTTFADGNGLQPGGTISFAIILFNKPECSVYVMGASAMDM